MYKEGKSGFKKGAEWNGNADGASKRGYQTFRRRAEHWMLNSTMEEIVKLATDNYELARMNPLDVTILKFIYNALTADTGDNENINHMFDRLFGKPKQEIETKVDMNVTADDIHRKTAAEIEAQEILAALEKRISVH